tara:strand:+ start:81 stop:368 length:288 start_codon:yes stop_codon:yes gene_type:complete
MLPNGMARQEPPPIRKGGKQPKILSDDKVKVLLNNPNVWYVVATLPKWSSGVVGNIRSMEQRNISHLKDKGSFECKQRKNNEGVDLYIKFVPIGE